VDSPFFINPWLLGEKCKQTIIRDAGKALHLVPQETLSTFRINGAFVALFSYFKDLPLYIIII